MLVQNRHNKSMEENREPRNKFYKGDKNMRWGKDSFFLINGQPHAKQ